MKKASLIIALLLMGIVAILSSCTKGGGGQYRIHGSVSQIKVNELNSNGAVIGTRTAVLKDNVSEVYDANPKAVSIEVPEQDIYSTFDNKKKTFTSNGPMALVGDGITELFLKTK